MKNFFVRPSVGNAQSAPLLFVCVVAGAALEPIEHFEDVRRNHRIAVSERMRRRKPGVPRPKRFLEVHAAPHGHVGGRRSPIGRGRIQGSRDVTREARRARSSSDRQTEHGGSEAPCKPEA